jgi:uncharacterized membrane protein
MKPKMFIQRILPLIIVFILPLICLSQLHFLNRTSKEIYVTILWYDDNNKQWILDGWYKVNPIQSRSLIPNKLTSTYYYYHAHSGDRLVEWNGNGDILRCLPYESFHYADYTYCPNGFTEYSFKKINVGSATDYTIELTSDEYPYVPPVSSNRSYSTPRTKPATQSSQTQSSNQQSQPFNLTPTAWTSVYITKEFDDGINKFYLVNANTSKDVWVTYNVLWGMASVIRTDKIKVSANSREYLGTDNCGSAYPGGCYFVKEDAYFAN